MEKIHNTNLSLYESLLIVDWKFKHQPVSKVVTYCPSLAQQKNKLGLRHPTLVNKDSQYPNTWDKIIKHVSFVKKKKSPIWNISSSKFSTGSLHDLHSICEYGSSLAYFKFKSSTTFLSSAICNIRFKICLLIIFS